MDPYLEATLASQCQSTPVATSTVCPRWNASMQFFPNNLSEDVICLTVFGKDYFSPDGKDYLFAKMGVIFFRFEHPWIACMVSSVCRVCCISTVFKICVGPFSNIRWDISKKNPDHYPERMPLFLSISSSFIISEFLGRTEIKLSTLLQGQTGGMFTESISIRFCLTPLHSPIAQRLKSPQQDDFFYSCFPNCQKGFFNVQKKLLGDLFRFTWELDLWSIPFSAK